MRKTIPIEQRLYPRLVIGPGGCLLWTGAKRHYGYGAIYYEGRVRPVHRIVWLLERGPIPDGLEIDHLCGVTACSNVDHLQAVTHRENVRRTANAAKTHCPQGHPYDEVNTGVTPNGWRVCRTCDRLATRRKRGTNLDQPQPKDRTHCKRGHPLSGDNLYLYGGSRHCRTCRRDRARSVRKDV